MTATLNIRELDQKPRHNENIDILDVQRNLIQDASIGKINFENVKRYKESIVKDFRRLSLQFLSTDTELTTALKNFLDELDFLLTAGSKETPEANIRNNVKRVNSDMSIEATFEILRVLTKEINGRKVFTGFEALNNWLSVHARNMPDLIKAVGLISGRDPAISDISNFQSAHLAEHIDPNDYFKSHENDLYSKDLPSNDNSVKTIALIVLFIHAAYMYMQYYRAVCAAPDDKASKDRINPDTPRTKKYEINGEQIQVEFPNPLLTMDELLRGILNISSANQTLGDNEYKAAFEIYKDLFYTLEASEILSFLEEEGEVRKFIDEATNKIRTKFVGETRVFRPVELTDHFVDTLNKVISRCEGKDIHKIKIALIQKFQETLFALNCDRTNIFELSATLSLIDPNNR